MKFRRVFAFTTIFLLTSCDGFLSGFRNRQALRLDVERAMMERSWGMRDLQVNKMRPQLPVILQPGTLPDATMPSPKLAKAAGVIRLETSWFDALRRPAKAAHTAGVYGAIIRVVLDEGQELYTYRSALLPTTEQWQALAPKAMSEATPAPIHERVAKASSVIGGDRYRLAQFAMPARPYAYEALKAWWHELKKAEGHPVDYPYVRYTPKHYGDDPDKRWPAVIFLHGSNRLLPSQLPTIDERKASHGHGMVEWASSRNAPILSYDLLTGQRWDSNKVVETLQKLIREDNIDPDRVVLVGFSMGGIGAWNVVVEHGHLWAGVIPVGGRGYRARDVHRIGNMPVWVFNGADDSVTTLADAQKVVRAGELSGAQMTLTVLDNVDHVMSLGAAFNTPGLLEWILDRHRTSIDLP